MAKTKPQLEVFARARIADSDGKRHWKRIGVAWQSETKAGVSYVKVRLDFMPNDCELTIYPNSDSNKSKTRTRFDAIAEEFD